VSEWIGTKGDKEMASQEKRSVTSKKSDIPPHYVALSSYGCDGKQKQATPAYRRLHAAWHSGELGGVKFMSTPTDFRGQIWIDPQDAAAILSACGLPESTEKKPKATDLITSARVASALERIAEALETIATQPEATRHTPFGDLLHASTNGDE
jgi:hypothetical protein